MQERRGSGNGTLLHLWTEKPERNAVHLLYGERAGPVYELCRGDLLCQWIDLRVRGLLPEWQRVSDESGFGLLRARHDLHSGGLLLHGSWRWTTNDLSAWSILLCRRPQRSLL